MGFFRPPTDKFCGGVDRPPNLLEFLIYVCGEPFLKGGQSQRLLVELPE